MSNRRNQNRLFQNRLTGFLIASVIAVGCSETPNIPVIDPATSPRTPLVTAEPDLHFTAIDGNTATPVPKEWEIPRKIFLPHEVRNGFVLPIGRRLCWRLISGTDPTLRCMARQAISDGEVRLVFTVRYDDQPANIVATVDVPGDRWTPITIPLEVRSGHPIEIECRAQAVGGTAKAPVLLANPEIIQDGTGDDRPDILLISVDTLRWDHLSTADYSRPTSPSIEHWAADRAVTFEQAIAAASWTLPSHVSMLTGLDAAHHGVNHDVGGSDRKTGAHDVADLVFLAEIVRRNGWKTTALTGGAYLDPRFGFAQGFDLYRSWPDRARDATELPTHVDDVLAILENGRNTPDFVFLHTYAVHDPYRAWLPAWKELFGNDPPPGRFALHSPKNDPAKGFRQVDELLFRPKPGNQRPLEPGEMETAVRMYDSGIRFVDDQIGVLFAALEERGLDRNMIVILTSDHGESLGEGGRFGHIDLTDEVIRVPLFISLPDRQGAGLRVKHQVRSVNILPTVLDVLGLEAPNPPDGRSLMPLIRNDPWHGPDEAFTLSSAANRGLSMRLTDGRKLIFDTTAWPDGIPQFRLFDLEKDPLELRPQTRNLPPKLISKLVDYLDKKAAGLRLEIRNHSVQTFEGRLTGPMIRPVGTKLLKPGPARLSFVEIGEATFSLAPREELHLSFEKVFGRRLKITARQSGGGAALSRTFNLRGGNSSLAFENSRWSEGRQGLITVHLGWHGGDRTLGEAPLEHDEDLRDQLRALGYVE